MHDIIRKIREKVEKDDKLVGIFGMKIQEVESGYALVTMEVTETHLNAAMVCHGAAILALEISINYVRPAKVGDKLKAISQEENISKKTGLYITKVFNQDEKLVAMMKSTAYRFDEGYPGV
jgi:acyl-CoA thioesterase